MTHIVKNLRKSEGGFTLVELAVVMIIIGLLIAGILKGQELIANARVTSTISQMQGIGAAVDGFTEAYNAQPGDMNDAVTRLVGCAAPCADGGGNGAISVNVGSIPAVGGGDASEGTLFFLHLAAGDFITGVDGTTATGGGAKFGGTNPTAPIGGGYSVGDTRTGVTTGFTLTEFRTGTYIALIGDITAVVGAGTGVLAASQAARIDRRLDDGVPDTGVVLGDAATGAGNCRSAVGVYNEADQSGVCSIAYRM